MAPRNKDRSKLTASPKKDNQSETLNTSSQYVSRGGFAMIGIPLENKLSGKYFGGVSLDANKCIGKTYLIIPNGAQITREDDVPPGFAHSYLGGPDQAYRDIATRMSEAAGKIYLELCRCIAPNVYNKQQSTHQEFDPMLQHPQVTMSGFWIQGNRFITSAHFADLLSISEKEKENTTAYQKVRESSISGRLKAVVSSEDRAPISPANISKPVSVYLIQIDMESDLAVFQAYNDPLNERPPRGLLKSDIITIDRCDKSQGVFTIGYYGRDRPIQGLTPHDEQVLSTFWPDDDGSRPETYFPVKYAGTMQKRDDTVRFQDVFQFPHHRTISMGEIGAPLPSRNARSTFVLCQMTAWFQSSGGMVGGFIGGNNGAQKQLQPAVFGIFRGDEGPQNVIAAFTETGIDWLFN